MNRPLVIAYALIAFAPLASATGEFFDRIEDALTFSSANTRVRARLSGTIDLEACNCRRRG
jgi:hypothetical protein